jgi:class 3 adenylate cyclase
MIELGQLRIETESSVVDARQKIAKLSEALGFDKISVTRMAIAVSQLCRTVLGAQEMFRLDVGLGQREGHAGLALTFNDVEVAGLIEFAQIFFDKVREITSPDGAGQLQVFRRSQGADFQPSQKFIERQRNRIGKLSKADQLLRVILPGSIAEELTSRDEVKTRRHEEVAVLFADIVGFTTFCDKREPEEVVQHLQELSLAFEAIAEKHQVEKIKTIGDCFMATAGLLTPVENPVLNCAKCGLEMLAAAKRMTSRWNLRIGIHIGPVTAGIVGHKRFSYDLWGDTVNTASRIESNGKSGSVNLSQEAWNAVAGELSARSIGVVPVKGKGELEIFCVSRW